MLLGFQAIDWYHCKIFRKRFFIFTELIGELSLSLDGEKRLFLYVNNSKINSCASFIVCRGTEVILHFRTQSSIPPAEL